MNGLRNYTIPASRRKTMKQGIVDKIVILPMWISAD